MGRVKGTHIKHMATALVNKYPSLFTTGYEKNKLRVKELGLMKDSKIEMHKLAGAIGNKVKQVLAGPRKRRVQASEREDRDRRGGRDFGGRGRDRD